MVRKHLAGGERTVSDLDPEIQRIIDAAEPGVLDVIKAYEGYEASYMASAHAHQTTVIVAGSNTCPSGA
jgi:hypothetical protein